MQFFSFLHKKYLLITWLIVFASICKIFPSHFLTLKISPSCSKIAGFLPSLFFYDKIAWFSRKKIRKKQCAALWHILKAKRRKISVLRRIAVHFESGGEGSRTPVLDTVDASISMFRRRLAALAGGPLCVSLPPSQEPVDVILGAVPPPGTCLLKLGPSSPVGVRIRV